MQWSRLTRWGLAVVSTASLVLFIAPAFAALKPGDKLGKSNCQEAKGLLPEHMMEKFCAGQYTATIIEVKDDAFQYSKKFKVGSEANAGKYYVTDQGYLYETATKTWPHFWYGFPFPDVGEKDPMAGSKSCTTTRWHGSRSMMCTGFSLLSGPRPTATTVRWSLAPMQPGTLVVIQGRKTIQTIRI